MDKKQLEFFKMFSLAGLELIGELFHEKGSEVPFSGNKIVYKRIFLGLINTKQVIADMSFKNGKQQGEFKLWYKNGQQWLKMGYHNGVPHGCREIWWENGEVEEVSFFEFGKVTEQRVTPNFEALQLFLNLYKSRCNQLGLSDKSNLKDKKAIESFLLHECDNAKEQLTLDITKNKKIGFEKFIAMYESSKNEIIEFIYKNV